MLKLPPTLRVRAILIDSESSDGVRRPREAAAIDPTRAPTPLRLLLVCGECGGGVGMLDRGRYGCIDRVRRRGCANAVSIHRSDIETRVVEILSEQLNRLDRDFEASGDHHDPLLLEKRLSLVADRNALGEVERGLAGFLAAIEDGLYVPAMKARVERLNAEGVRLRGRILVASTVADAEQTAALRHRAALGQLIDRATAGRATDDDAVHLRDLFGPIALLPTGERGECRLVYIGKPHGS